MERSLYWKVRINFNAGGKFICELPKIFNGVEEYYFPHENNKDAMELIALHAEFVADTFSGSKESEYIRDWFREVSKVFRLECSAHKKTGDVKLCRNFGSANILYEVILTQRIKNPCGIGFHFKPLSEIIRQV